MSREKQIEEMGKILCGMKNGCDGCMWDKEHCNERNYAEEIYNEGYRKAYDVAEKIFVEIEEQLRRLADQTKMLRDKEINLVEKTKLNGEWIGVLLALRAISKLKNKHTEREEETKNVREGRQDLPHVGGASREKQE